MAEKIDTSPEGIRGALQAILDVEVEVDVVRQPQLGEVSALTEARPIFDRIKPLVAALLRLDLSQLSPDERNALGGGAATFNAAVAAAAAWLPSEVQDGRTAARQPTSTQGQILQSLRQAEGKFGVAYARVAPRLLAHAARPPEVDELLAELSAAKTDAERLVSETQAALQTVQDLAKQSGVEVHSPEFDSESRTFKGAAQKWLIAAAVFAAIGLGALGWFWHLGHPADATTQEVLYILSLRGSALAIVIAGVIFCTRNFSAARHNEIVNRHRAIALTTFQTFIQGAAEPATKDAVLLEATRAIFAGHSTGYLSGDAGDPPAPSVLHEVVRQTIK